MDDLRKKVIRGLEICLNTGNFDECTENCPYFTKKLGVGVCSENMKRDALSLLKAQEPRVMTLEEVITHYSLPPVVLDDLNWQEDYLQDIEPLYFDFPVEDSWAVHWRGYQQVRKYLKDWKASYGERWRCWTARPTEEQREAIPWN